MANQNYRPGIGRLATDRYDFQDHVDGYNFRHKADNVDLNPNVSIDTGSGTILATELQEAIEALASNTVVPTVNPANAAELGVVRLNPSGDVAGSANLLKVVGIQGLSVQFTAIGDLNDGYLLTWDSAASQWIPKSPSFVVGPASTISPGIVQLSGDVGGAYNNLTVEKLQTYDLNLSSPSAGNFIGWDSIQEEYTNMNLPVATTSDSGIVQLGADTYTGINGPDITGSYNSLKVKGIQNFYVYPDAPSVGKVLTWGVGALGEGWIPKDLNITSSNLPSADASNKGGVRLQGDIGGSWENLKVKGFYNQSFTESSFESTGNYYITYYYDDGNGFWKTAYMGDFVGKDLYSANYNEQEVRGIYGNPIIDQDGYAVTPNNNTILIYLDEDHAQEIYGPSAVAGWYPTDADVSGFTPSNDLSGSNTSQNVIAITGATGATGYTGDLANRYVANVKADYLTASNGNDFYITKYSTNLNAKDIYIKGQESSGNNGGNSILLGGDSTATEKNGGSAFVVGGYSSYRSGSVYILTQNADLVGSISISAGGSTGGKTGGGVAIRSGDGYSAGQVYISGGTGASGSYGGEVLITGGNATSGVTDSGGNVLIKSGDATQYAGISAIVGGNGGILGGISAVLGGAGPIGGPVLIGGGVGAYAGSVFVLGGATTAGPTAGAVIIGSGVLKDSYLLQVNSNSGGYVGLAASSYISDDVTIGATGVESNPTAGGKSVVYIADSYEAPTGATANAPTNGTVLYSKDQDLWVARGSTNPDGYIDYHDVNYSIAAGPNPIRRAFEFPGSGSDYIRSKNYKYTYARTIAAGGSVQDLFEYDSNIGTSPIVYLKGHIIVSKAGTSRDGTYSIYEFAISYSNDGVNLVRHTPINFTRVVNGSFTPTTTPDSSSTYVKIQTGSDNTSDTDWVINLEAFVSEAFVSAVVVPPVVSPPSIYIPTLPPFVPQIN